MRERRRRKVFAEGWVPATRFDLDRWMKTPPQPWSAALEATMFSGCYDHLKPHAAQLKAAHPLMLRAIAAAKKKNDRIEAKQDLRLFALRFSAGMLHGADRHPFQCLDRSSPEAFEVGRYQARYLCGSVAGGNT